MNNQNMYYYRNYYPYNNAYNYSPYTTFFNPYTQNLPNQEIEINQNDTPESKEKVNDEAVKNIEKDNNRNTSDFKLGPLEISDNKINIFGFSIEIDDLILIVLIIFLFFETDCDYSLLIVLGLILFNISFSSLDFLK